MKILHVSSSLYPFKIGGIGLYVHEMANLQSELGHDVTVYTTKHANIVKQELFNNTIYKYKVLQFKPVIRLSGNPIVLSMLPSLMYNTNKFDIIHAHSHLHFSTNLCTFVKKIKSFPFIITNHGLISQTASDWLNNIYLSTIAKWVFNSADRITCFTEAERQILEDKIGIKSSKVQIIHSGIDINVFTPSDKEKNRVQNYIMWCGRFVPGKGLTYLIDALGILSKTHSALKLVLIGDGPEKEKIKHKIHNLNLDNHVITKDFVSLSDLIKTYQNSDAFVLPSIYEGFPRTMMEAMACGTPVVCSKLPQLTDAVKGCGLLVPKENPEALAEAISKIISDKSLSQKLGENGRKKVVEDYSWDDTVKKTIKLYEELGNRRL